MKRMPEILSVLACLTFCPNLTLASEGSSARGGGHGVKTPSGKILVLDGIPNSDAMNRAPIADLFADPATRASAQMVVNALLPLEAAYPTFTRRLKSVFSTIRWSFALEPLEYIPDHQMNRPVPGLEQIARQYATVDEVKVDLDREKFLNALPDDLNRAVILAHELFLAKLGTHFDRGVLRDVLQALFSNHPDRIQRIGQKLDSVSPYILQGIHFVEVRSSLDTRNFSPDNCHRPSVRLNGNYTAGQGYFGRRRRPNSSDVFTVTIESRCNTGSSWRPDFYEIHVNGTLADSGSCKSQFLCLDELRVSKR